MSSESVTLIENLPQLQQLEKYEDYENYKKSIIPPEQFQNVSKFIRVNKPYQPVTESYSPAQNNKDSPYQIEQYPTRVKEEVKTIDMPENSPSCLDVAEHIMNCPLCSKFYHNDNTIYIITIIVLVIIVVLLLKKVLDL